MNTQEIIQALIRDRLIENAKIQAQDRNGEKLSMLIAIATSKAVANRGVYDTMYELSLNPDLYN